MRAGVVGLLASALACQPGPEPVAPGLPNAPYNLLVILTDDVGVDLTGTYGGRVPTPTIDGLAAQGVRFTNAYANPTCSPSRVSLLTGRHASRTGVGRWLSMHSSDVGLSDSEETLPEILDVAPWEYATAAVGKWHMNTALESDVLMAPMERGGFDTFAGVLGNPRDASVRFQEGDPIRGYTNWEKVVDGAATWSSDYLTTDTADEAITAIETLPEPWFLYVATSAAHEPWHVPPTELSGVSDLTPNDARPRLMDAMVTALEVEVARVLDALTEAQRARTVIVFATDNGSTPWVIESPWDPDRGKGTTYDGGVRVPMVVSGPIVDQPGRTSDALVHFVDIFATLAQVAGVGLPEGSIDGESFLPLLTDASAPPVRDWVYTEGFLTGAGAFDDQMVRNATHKYRVRRHDDTTTEELFRYVPDALDEGPNLLDSELSGEDAAAFDELTTLFAEVAPPE